jgi:hypothetical protein
MQGDITSTYYLSHGDAKHVLAKLVIEYRGSGAEPARLSAWGNRIEGGLQK